MNDERLNSNVVVITSLGSVKVAEKLNKNPFLERIEYICCLLESSLSPLRASSKNIYHFPSLS